MNFADLLIKTTRDQTNRAIQNNASDLCIGTMSGTNAVTLEEGYTVSGSMLSFTQFCYDQVISLPYKDASRASHKHDIYDALHNMMGLTETGSNVVFYPEEMHSVVQQDPTTAYGTLSGAGMTKLQLKHDHDESEELPQIRLWRGVKDGDRVLVLKVNTRHFVVLCRLGAVTNEDDEECKGYESVTT